MWGWQPNGGGQAARWVSLDGDMMREAIKPPGLALLRAGLLTSAPGEQHLDGASPAASPWQGGRQRCYCTKEYPQCWGKAAGAGIALQQPFSLSPFAICV